MRPFLLAWTAALALAFAAGGFTSARADDGPSRPSPLPSPTGPSQSPSAVNAISADVMILHGTNSGTGIDPAIGKMPALSKPPFSSYNSYKLLSRTSSQIAQGNSASVKLPNARSLVVAFKSVLQPKKAGDPVKYVITAGVQGAQVEVNAKAGEWFFVAGQEHKGGTLVIGIKVSP